MLGTMKTDKNISREATARRFNAKLVGTGIHVTSGGGQGPYQLTVSRLNKKQLGRLLKLIRTFTIVANR